MLKKKLMFFMTLLEALKTFTGYPLTILKAIAGNIKNYLLYGNSEQKIEGFDYTNYTSVEYCKNSADTKVRTGVIPTVEDCEYYCRFYAQNTNSLYLFTSRGGSTQGTTQYGISGSSSNGTITFLLSGTTITSVVTRTAGHVYQVKATCSSAGAMTLYVKDETDGTESTVTGTVSSWTAAESQLDLFANEQNDYLDSGYRIYEVYYKEAGIEKLHYYPATNSSSTVGFFDTVSQTFKEKTSGTLTAGNTLPTPATPVEIESCGDKTKNLFDVSTIKEGYFIRAGNTTTEKPLGEESTSSSWSCSDYIKVSPSTTYTVTYPFYQSATAGGLVYFTNNTVAGAISGVTTNAQGSEVYTFTTPSTCNYIRFSWNKTEGNDCQLELGSSSTSYEPYGYKVPIVVGSNCGIIDLGSINWNYAQIGSYGYSFFYTSSLSSLLKYQGYGYCSKLSIVQSGSSWNIPDNTAFIGNNSTTPVLYIRCDTYTTAAAFKQAMSGVYLYYQRATDTSWTTPTITNIYLDEPLRKVGNYADYIDYENQQVIRNVTQKIFYGTETFGYSNDMFSINLANGSASSDTGNVCLSNYFAFNSVQTGIYLVLQNGQFAYQRVNKNMFFKNSAYTTVEDWKAWLASQYNDGNPVIAYYVLATPTTEVITLPALAVAGGTNYITTNTEVAPSNMSATVLVEG